MNRPYVHILAAMSIDGRIHAARGASSRIFDAMATDAGMGYQAKARAESDAILVGINTVIADDPRFETSGSPLMPVILDSHGRIPLESRLMRGRASETLICVAEGAPQARVDAIRAAGAEVFVSGDRQCDLSAVLGELAARGVRRLLVEGGSTVIGSFLTLGCFDALDVVIFPLIIGDDSALSLATLTGGPRMLRLLQTFTLDRDTVLCRYTLAREEER